MMSCHYKMVNKFGQRHRRFCRYAGNKANSTAKELDTTNINWKGEAPNPQIGLPLNVQFLIVKTIASFCRYRHFENKTSFRRYHYF